MSFQEHSATHWFGEHNLEISLLIKSFSVSLFTTILWIATTERFKGIRPKDQKDSSVLFSIRTSAFLESQRMVTCLKRQLSLLYTKNISGFTLYSHLPSTLILSGCITYYSIPRSLISDSKVTSIQHTCLTSNVSDRH